MDTPEMDTPESGSPDPSLTPERPRYRRAITALVVYAALAIVAAFRLDGRPRLVVWLFLGLFAVKTFLLVLKQRTD
jgi:hypothetical protein